MRKTDAYRREAEQAERLARQMSRLDQREECLRIARAWRDLAEAEEAEAAEPDAAQTIR